MKEKAATRRSTRQETPMLLPYGRCSADRVNTGLFGEVFG